jgi:hypothetical protein
MKSEHGRFDRLTERSNDTFGANAICVETRCPSLDHATGSHDTRAILSSSPVRPTDRCSKYNTQKVRITQSPDRRIVMISLWCLNELVLVA